MKPLKNQLSSTHIGWDTQDHLKEFDHWNKMNKYEFIFKYVLSKNKSILKRE